MGHQFPHFWDRLAGLGGRIEIAASWELRRACANAGLTATWAMCPRPTTPYRIVRRIALTWCRPFRMPRKPGALAPDRTESQEPLGGHCRVALRVRRPFRNMRRVDIAIFPFN